MKRAIVCLVLLAAPANADETTNGPNGINATGLQLPNGNQLDGAGVGIGQVEGFRPGKPNFDDPAHSATTVVPEQVYRGTGAATPDEVWINAHAEEVASVMISTDSRAPGVAPAALLHSAGVAMGGGQRSYALTAYQLARRSTSTGDEINVINMSFGLELDAGEDTAGSSHLTSFVDWSATRQDVLYVVAGREEIGGAGPVPTDNYNGITVASSAKGVASDQFSSTWSANVFDDDPEGERVAVDLLAPGDLFEAITLGTNVTQVSGTSFAAPLVTGAAALLHQYGKHQIDNAGWSTNARRHEVMKAVMLNSADKLSGVHGSTRTVLNNFSQSWDLTQAYFDPATSLDMGMGAGHLNVANAVTNYAPGEQEPGTVPTIGWDFSPISSSPVDYVLDTPVSGWVAVTLCWDRIVRSTEVGQTYNSGTEFFNNPIEQELTDLDIYLVDGNDTVLHSSVSSDDSVEHIFFNVESTENLTIRVVNNGGGTGEEDGYALAWWAGELAGSTPGDFDGDGDVDGDDLGDWKSNFGTGPGADADGDGDSDGADFLAWQQNFGTGVPVAPSSGTVPEPTALALALIGLPLLRQRRRATEQQ